MKSEAKSTTNQKTALLQAAFVTAVADLCLDPASLPSPFRDARPSANLAELVALHWVAEITEGRTLRELCSEICPRLRPLEIALLEENLLGAIKVEYPHELGGINTAGRGASRLFNQCRDLFLEKFKVVDNFHLSDVCTMGMADAEEKLGQVVQSLQAFDAAGSKKIVETLEAARQMLFEAHSLGGVLAVVCLLTREKDDLSPKILALTGNQAVADGTALAPQVEMTPHQKSLSQELQTFFSLNESSANTLALRLGKAEVFSIPQAFGLSQNDPDLALIGAVLAVRPDLIEPEMASSCATFLRKRIAPLEQSGFTKAEITRFFYEAPKLLSSDETKYQPLLEHLCQLKLRYSRFAATLHHLSPGVAPEGWLNPSNPTPLSLALTRCEKRDVPALDKSNQRITEHVIPKMSSLYGARHPQQVGRSLCTYPPVTAAILLAMRDLETDAHGTRVVVDTKERDLVSSRVRKVLANPPDFETRFNKALSELIEYGVLRHDAPNIVLQAESKSKWPQTLITFDAAVEVAQRPRGGLSKSRH